MSHPPPRLPVQLVGLVTTGRATADGTSVEPTDAATRAVDVRLDVAPDVDVHRVVRAVRDAVDRLAGELLLERRETHR